MRILVLIVLLAVATCGADNLPHDIYSLKEDPNSVLRIRENFEALQRNKVSKDDFRALGATITVIETNNYSYTTTSNTYNNSYVSNYSSTTYEVASETATYYFDQTHTTYLYFDGVNVYMYVLGILCETWGTASRIAGYLIYGGENVVFGGARLKY